MGKHEVLRDRRVRAWDDMSTDPLCELFHTIVIFSVLGREFSYELIAPVAQRPDRELQAALRQLSDAGLLFCRGTAPHATYLFKHALVQDAAYGTLLRGGRQKLHG